MRRSRITRVHLKNFQGHRDTTVEFSPRVTTVIGANDIGKSTLLRAIQWVAFNRAPKNLHHHGTKTTSVELVVGGHVVRRTRGRANTYHLDGKRFRAFGTRVPDQITRLLNLGERNFQGQADPPGFWFSKTPGQVSRELNKVVDLSVIDTTLSKLAEGLRASRAEEKVISSRLAEARAERREHLPTRRAARELRALTKKEAVIVDEAERYVTLARLVGKAARQGARLRRLAQAVTRGQKVVAAGQCWLDLDQQVVELGALSSQAERARTLRGAPLPSTTTLDALAASAHVARARVAVIEDKVDSCTRNLEKITECSHLLREQEHQLERFKRCPTCLQKIR